MSEAAFSFVGIEGLYIDSEEMHIKTVPKDKRIEFIGDSITCGYGIEGVCEIDEFSTSSENCLKAYAALVANHFNADFNLISWSGIGVISNYVEEDVNEPLDECLMPKLYKYTDLEMSKRLKLNNNEIWNNDKFSPDIVVINLGTNDTSYTRGICSRIDKFKEEYYNFINYVRSHNKDATILCILGVMGQELCESVEEVVNKYSYDNNDYNIYYKKLDLQKDEDGIGVNFHPSEKTHNKMAESIIRTIKQIKKW